jgi:hypothetical protein
MFALLDGSTGCGICGKALTDEVSTLLHIGPGCAKKVGRPHDLAAAGEAVARRNTLLKAAEAQLTHSPA